MFKNFPNQIEKIDIEIKQLKKQNKTGKLTESIKISPIIIKLLNKNRKYLEGNYKMVRMATDFPSEIVQARKL